MYLSPYERFRELLNRIGTKYDQYLDVSEAFSHRLWPNSSFSFANKMGTSYCDIYWMECIWRSKTWVTSIAMGVSSDVSTDHQEASTTAF